MTDDASWVDGAEGSGFGLAHLPYGIFDVGDTPRVGVAVGGFVLDLARAAAFLGVPAGVFETPTLNAFMAQGAAVWAEVRAGIQQLLAPDAPPRPELLHRRSSVHLHLPFAVADYVDFSAFEAHVTTAGRLFRPHGDPLPPAWRHLPIGYHGRAGSVVVSGTTVHRPCGQRRPADRDLEPSYGPSHQLDFELEVAFVVGTPSQREVPVSVDDAAEHVFGVVLLNDWSARDLQAWESQPLGPFLGKSFATSIAGWVTPLAALEPFRVAGPPQEPKPLPHLRAHEPWGLALELAVDLTPAGGAAEEITRSAFAGMYWTLPQLLAHATSNGAALRTGDLFASGTVSGWEEGSQGCLLERTLGGSQPLRLADAAERDYLEDGDVVTLRGWCGERGSAGWLQLGEVTGAVAPAYLARPASANSARA